VKEIETIFHIIFYYFIFFIYEGAEIELTTFSILLNKWIKEKFNYKEKVKEFD
jgi:hypothetical protein